MNWLNWNDFLAPSNPYAAILLGVIGTLIVAATIWVETKERRTLWVAIISGTLTTLIGVGVLNLIGFY
ncbi:hypothetical protein [Rossellomorea aquimaris]|uniref:hypothetical protein n=1 Tax=Rossellomorea aquimaris TaxID=189382 RepID=UPI0007D0A3AF|nr:hypothetical protein [Rossellomorea aquimaris]